MNKYAAPKPTEENTYRFTDGYGDTLNVLPDGAGGFLVEIHPADGGRTYSVAVNHKHAAVEAVVMLRIMLDSTGKGERKIRQEAIANGLIRDRKPVFNPGASFGVKV